MNFTKKQTWLIIIGLALMISNSFVLYAIFLEAYFNDFVAIFEINRFGEAPFEFVFMPINILLGFNAIWFIVKDLRDRKHETTKV